MVEIKCIVRRRGDESKMFAAKFSCATHDTDPRNLFRNCINYTCRAVRV